MDWQTAREPLASLFYNRRHHIAKQQHAVERTRELFAKSPAMQNLKPVVTTLLHSILRETEEHAAPYLVFLHATTRDDKHWPETHWRRLIELMQPCGIHIKLPWALNMSVSVRSVWQPVFPCRGVTQTHAGASCRTAGGRKRRRFCGYRVKPFNRRTGST